MYWKKVVLATLLLTVGMSAKTTGAGGSLVSSLSAKTEVMHEDLSNECYKYINMMGTSLEEGEAHTAYLWSMIALDVCVPKSPNDMSLMVEVYGVHTKLEQQLKGTQDVSKTEEQREDRE